MTSPSSPLLVNKRRAAGPILSPEHFHSARSLSGSHATTGTSSSFLTPFLPGPRTMSPPPKQEADDYLSVYGYSNGGKNHNKKARKRNNTVEEEELRHDEDFTTSKPQSMNSAVSDDEPCASEEHDSDLYSPSAPPLAEERRHLVLRTDIREDDAQSPAEDALRSLSQPQPSRSDFESRNLRRMSSALANTFKFLKSRTPTTKSLESNRSISPITKKRRTHKRNIVFQDGDRRRPTVREVKEASGRLTPSSITLRKASNANMAALPGSSMSASLGHEDENLRSIAEPASELLAFYSSKTDKTPLSTSSISPSIDVWPSPLKLTQEAPSETERRSSKTTCPTAVHFSQIQRHSTLAANTLTFTDVHVAPGTFAVDAKSRKQSLAVAEPPQRRISVIQFRSNTSVHEIIWREDETTSGSSLVSSSRTSASPNGFGQQFQSAQPSPEPESHQTKTLRSSAMSAIPEPSSVTEQPQVGLYQWSWGKTTAASDIAAQTIDRKHSRPELGSITGASHPDMFRTRRSTEPYSAVEGHERSISKTQDIQSFPPLRDRSSTLEWRKAPLVDINEPLAGLEHESDAQDFNGTHDNAWIHQAGRDSRPRQSWSTRRSRSHPYAPARTGSIGRVGSSVGSSSHVRVRTGHKLRGW